MPSLFADRFESVAMPIVETHHGVSVVVQNGDVSTDAFIATFVNFDAETVDHRSGVKLNIKRRRYSLPKTSVAIGGSEFEPAPGMVVVQGSDKFEILPMTKEVAVQSDAAGYRWIVEAKQIVFS